MTDIAALHARIDLIRGKAKGRDQRMQDVHDVRSGDIETIMPGAFPDAWPKPIVANVIDTTARDLAEVIAPLPSVNCASGIQSSQRGKNFASKRTKIANHYISNSDLKIRMIQAADYYITYGFVPFVVEPDFEAKMPYIRVDNPIGAYPEYDLRGRIRSYTRVWREEAHVLAAKFPEYARRILGDDADRNSQARLEVVKFCDKDRYVMYLPERQNQVLMDIPNPFGKVPVCVAYKPGYDEEFRGQFDDVIWIQLARARMALLGMEATEKSVKAPLAVPSDVTKFPYGDDAIIRTNSPEKIRRVGLDVPQQSFQQEQLMSQEVRAGSRTPAARSGESNASIITGKGVQALMGGFDTQIKAAQTVMGRTIEDFVEMCFEMDEKYWGEEKKQIRGTVQGTPFEESYIPSRDIHGNYIVDVTYGFASGMDPSQALVFLLQLRGDQDISRDFLQRQLPMEIDIAQMQAQIDVEQATDALKQGIFSMLQSMGIMAQQGMDPTQILMQTAQIIKLREDGKSMHEAIIATFVPKEPKAAAPAGQAGMESPDEAAAAAGGLPPGMQASGLPFGVAPGQAGMGEGGRPDVQTLLAGLTGGGKPSMSSSVKRSVPA